MGSIFGQIFRISTFGESHGQAVGVIIDGCPAGLVIDAGMVQSELDRRRPGQSKLVTQRKESDTVQILSGTFEGKTTGTSIALIVQNEDAMSSSYESFHHIYRPSHADYTFDAKYGFRDWRGGGRSSARETVARVAAGAVAQILLASYGIEIIAWVDTVHQIKAQVDPSSLTRDLVDAHPTRCPDPAASALMEAAIMQARADGDSLGGTVRCVVRNCPPGLGDPVFDKLEARLGMAMLSIPAVKGFEVGSGFDGTLMKGSEHNDPFVTGEDGKVHTTTNNSGGIQGGISNGEDIRFRIAVKPTATITRDQQSVTQDGEPTTLRAKGRHDPCVLPRAVPVVEAMTALVLADCLLLQRSAKL
ncbi:MAG: chorismate synthase [Armatimonadota bacterium]